MQRSQFLRSAGLIPLTLALLVGCGSPSAPAPSTPPDAAPTITLRGAVATSATSVLLTLKEGSTSSLDPARYRITGSGGGMLEVRGVYALPGGGQLLLETAAQAEGDYLLSVGSAPGVKFTGSAAPAPTVQQALALNHTQVLLRFTAPGGVPVRLHSAAEQAGLYHLLDLNVTAAKLSADKSAVLLSTAPQSDTLYRAETGGVFTEGYALVKGEGTFTGIPQNDVTPPRLLEAVAADRQSVRLRFSEPLKSVSADQFTVLDASGLPLRVTRAAFTDEYQTDVLLTTDTQQDGTYRVNVSGVADGRGNVLDPSAGSASFAGSGTQDTTAPTLRGVQSGSSTSLTVTFSEPVRGGTDEDGAENPANYTVQGVPVSGQSIGPAGAASSLRITAARLAADGRSVTLTTLEQADIQYELSAVKIRDLVGNVIDSTTGVQRQKIVFRGTPPGGPGVDSDGDGLSDSVEQAGWTVAVTMADGRIERRDVTSDPTNADTDGDCLGRANVNDFCLNDRDERALALDPRSLDTDGDTLGDNEEYNLILSNPIDQDSDKDGLNDTLEVLTYRTSPLLADTDGDQIKDGVEVITDNRNPAVADLPVPGLGVGNVDLRLDVRFTATSGQNSRTLENRAVSSTLTENQSQSQATSDSKTTEWFVKAGAKFGFEQNIGAKEVGTSFKFNQELSIEGGTSGSATSSFTNESARSSQKEYANSLTTEKEVARDETVTREVAGATMAVALNMKNAGNIAFTVKNLEITALLQDPQDPSSFIPVATLLPEGNAAAGINLGPLVPERGPFRFSTDKAAPSLIEALMRDPRGLIFRIANYDITDELGRNFAFTSQDINDRTAELSIDYAGLRPLETYRVATNSFFDETGRPQGTTIRRILENVLHLKQYDRSKDATLTAEQLRNSYSTHEVNGVELVWRVRDVSQDLVQTRKNWFFINQTGIDETIDFGSTPVKAGGAMRLAFVQDLDKDGLTLAQENLYPSFDDLVKGTDSDGDEVGDGDEVNGPKVTLNGETRRQPWTVAFNDAQQGYVTSANPGRQDTDLDGLSDCQELGLCDLTTQDGKSLLDQQGQVRRLTKITDPADPDTDGDGLLDSVEVRGYLIKSVKNGQDFSANSDPLSRDSDGDGLSDSRERRVGTNPTISDADDVLDNDGDGLVNIEETTGVDVTWKDASGQVYTARATTDKNNPDTDGDGLPDGQERTLGTNGAVSVVSFAPISKTWYGQDTDGDGLTDRQEVNGSPFQEDAANPVRKTDPLKGDTDGDTRSDGDEIKTPWTVRVEGQAPYDVHSDPTDKDADRDRLPDDQEFGQKSNPYGPKASDTDSDSTLDGDEVARGTAVLVPDYLVTVTYKYFQPGPADNRNADCDEDKDTGDFHFSFNVMKPGNSNATAVVQTSDVAGYENWTWGKSTVSVVHASETQRIVLNKSLRFNLPFTETFTLEGFMQEIDQRGEKTTDKDAELIADGNMNFSFGGVGAEGGIYSGSSVTKGTTDVLFAKTDGTCKMRIVAAVNVQ